MPRSDIKALLCHSWTTVKSPRLLNDGVLLQYLPFLNKTIGEYSIDQKYLPSLLKRIIIEEMMKKSSVLFRQKNLCRHHSLVSAHSGQGKRNADQGPSAWHE